MLIVILFQPLSVPAKALIYTVAVNYHARLSEREKFEKEIVDFFQSPCEILEDSPLRKVERFREEILRYNIDTVLYTTIAYKILHFSLIELRLYFLML